MKLFSYISTFILLLTLTCAVKAQTSDTVCKLNYRKVYKVLPTPGSKYFWKVECGKIVSVKLHTDSIEVDWCKTPGTYQVSVIEQNKWGCWGDTVRTWVMVNGNIHLLVTGPSDICEGEPVRLNADGAQNYLWNTGETTSSIFSRPKDSIKYRVIGYNTCEKDTAYISVKVHARPRADFTYKPKKPILVDETVFFHYTGKGANKWVWYFGDRNAIEGTVTDPEFSFSEKGDKLVTLVATNEAGCTDTMTYSLHVTFDSKIFIPNSFTPNDDGVNDKFKAVGYNLKSIHTRVFNRWGELIYESGNMDDAWDGTYKGERVMEGVYIYMIEAQAKDGEPYYLNGNITVAY
jgi:gliding motility-associated-like protein